MIVQSNAKINVFLDITGRDPADGYHYLDSLFQEVSLADTINIEPSAVDYITYTGMDIKGDTTVHKALRAFRDLTGIRDGYTIRVDKKIPIGAGLGGGSSNAGAVLRYLGRAHGVGLPVLLQAAARVGSDVPFFLYGGMCRVSGKGELVKPLDVRLQDCYFLVVYPDIFISTPWAYSVLEDRSRSRDFPGLEKVSFLNIDLLNQIVYNKLQVSVFRNKPELEAVYNGICSIVHPELSWMSGSGSSLVFAYRSRGTALQMLEELKRNQSYPAYICEPVYSS